MPKTKTRAARRLSLEDARRVWIAAQGLPAGDGKLLPTIQRTGFLRTLGGVDVYLAARARSAGMPRKALDDLVVKGLVKVIPAVRGCIYLVANADVPTALRFAETLTAPRAAKEQARAGMKKGELAKVAKAVHAVLVRQGQLTTDAIRRALAPGTVRPLGEAGKKVGITSPLPSALRALEFAGEVERALEGGQLDSERYAWRATARDPFAGKVPGDRAGLLVRLAEVFLR